MKRIVWILFLMPIMGFGQAAARVDIPLQTLGPNVPSSGGPLPQTLWVANAKVAVCTHPSATYTACLGSPVTTYTDATLGTACPTTAQLVQLPGNTCTASSGAAGNVGLWYSGGIVDYWVQSAYGTFGPYTVTNSNGSGSGTVSAQVPGFQPLSTATTVIAAHGGIGVIAPGFWGSGTNNIASFFASPTCTGQACSGEVDPTYGNTEHYSFPSDAWTSAASQASLDDKRNGSREFNFHNPAPSLFDTLNNPMEETVVQDTIQPPTSNWGGGTTHMNAFENVIKCNSPGLDAGNLGYGIQGWTNCGGFFTYGVFNTQGISTTLGQTPTKAGIGDFQGFSHVGTNYGGAVAPSDQGYDAISISSGESTVVYTGTVATGGSGATAVTVTCTHDCQNPGNLRYLIDTQNVVSSGNVTAITQPSGNTPGTMTIDQTVTASTAWGTLNSNCIPSAPIGGYTTTNPQGVTYSSTTCSVSTTSGTFTNGSLVCFAENAHEQAQITTVSGSGGSTLITLPLLHAHANGSWIMQGGPCGSFIDFTANDVTPTTQTLHYPIDIIGATATNTLIYRQFYHGTGNNGVSLGLVLAQQLGFTTLSNIGGTVYMTAGVGVVLTQHQELLGTTITITGATNSVFNGNCTNSFLVIGTSNQIACQQSAANDGQTSANANVAVGTSGYGTTAYTLWYGAQVIDVLDHSQTPPVVNSTTGHFALEPNQAAWAASDTVEEPHHYELQADVLTSSLQLWNPMQASKSPINVTVNGKGNQGGNPGSLSSYSGTIQIINGQSATGVYKNHGGGTVTPPGGIKLIAGGANTGLFNYGLAMQQAPDPLGSDFLFVGCPLSGCNDKSFYYYPMFLSGNGGTNGGMQFVPAYGETIMGIGGPVVINSDLGAQIFHGQVSLATMALPVNATFTTIATGDLPSGTYSYRIQAVNACGSTLASTGTTLPTGGGPNNSVIVNWSRVIGATSYKIYGRTAGSELLLKTVVGVDTTQWVDDGSLTPSGALPSADTSRGCIAGAAYLQLVGSTSGQAVGIKANASQTPATVTLPALPCSSGQYWADNGTGTYSCTTPGANIANVQITTGTTLIGANSCTSSTATTMTGVATTTAIIPPTPTTDTSSVTGWGSTGGLSFTYWVTTNTFNWRVCNSTASPITPGGSVVWNVGAQ